MEEHFDQVALLVQSFVVTTLCVAVPGRRDNWIDAASLECIDESCSVIATISHACASWSEFSFMTLNVFAESLHAMIRLPAAILYSSK